MRLAGNRVVRHSSVAKHRRTSGDWSELQEVETPDNPSWPNWNVVVIMAVLLVGVCIPALVLRL